MVVERKGKSSYSAGLATRDLILNEATRMIAEYGYHGMTLRDLARRIGISHPAVIYHFPNKEAMVQAVILRFEEEAGIIEVNFNEETGEMTPIAVIPQDYQDYAIALMRLGNRPDVVQALAFSAVLEWEPVNTSHPLYTYSETRRQLINNFIRRETLRLRAAGVWQFVLDEQFVARMLMTLWAGTVHQARCAATAEHNTDCVASFLATTVVVLKIAPSELMALSERVPEPLMPMFQRVMQHVANYLE